MVDTTFVLVSATCYSELIAPAAARFSDFGDTSGIVTLLRQGQSRLRLVPPDQHPFAIGGEPLDVIQGALDILEGREFYGPSTDHIPPAPGARTSEADLKMYVEEQVYALLFEGVCVAYDAGVPVRQVLTRGRLLPYLYEHSHSLEDAFTGGLRGEPLPLLPTRELLARSDVADLLSRMTQQNTATLNKSGGLLRRMEVHSYRASMPMSSGRLHHWPCSTSIICWKDRSRTQSSRSFSISNDAPNPPRDFPSVKVRRDRVADLKLQIFKILSLRSDPAAPRIIPRRDQPARFLVPL